MTLRCALAPALAAALGYAPLAGASEAGEAALRDLLGSPALRGARIGLAVERLATGERLLERDPDRNMVPASNQKVIVAAAALAEWGPAHRFETPVLTRGEIDAAGVLDGELWIQGRGDPSLVSETLWKLAEEIALRGITEIRGGIGIDTSYFDRAAIHPDWEPVSARSYHAPTAAFAANYSSFRIDVFAGPESGAPVVVRVAPGLSYFSVRADARTLLGRGALSLERAPAADGRGELVRVRGSFPLGAPPKTYWRSVALPEPYAAAVLRAQLEAQGIQVSGPVRIGKLPEDARELLRFEGERLDTLVHRLNKYSNNFIAEQLMKLLGAERFGVPGSWESGRKALGDYLDSIGVSSRKLVIADGSGLSARNRLSPAVLVRVIREAALRFASGPEFMASLSLGGLDGTLEDRMNGEFAGGVRAKTGHLSHVSSLSGILPDATGEVLAFAILVNNARGNAREVDQAIDSFVTALGGGLAASAEPDVRTPSSPE